MAQIDGRSVFYRRTDGNVTRVIAGETLIVPVRGHVADLESIFRLNDVGTFIWERIDGAAASDLAAAVEREFSVSPQQASSDTLAFLQSLAAARLVETSEEPR